MQHRFGHILSLAVLLASAACRIEPGTHASRPDAMTPPRPLDLTRPVLVGATVQNSAAVEIAVDVDPQGKADLATLQVTGTNAVANRDAIADWLRAIAFEPARKNGKPVRGTFRMTAETRVAAERE